MNNLLLSFALILSFQLQAQTYVDIPDNNFLTSLKNQYVDKNLNGVIETEEALSVSSLTLFGNIYSLKGIEAFSNLSYLNFSFCPVYTVDLTQNAKLTHLYLGTGYLPNLDVSKNTQLRYLEWYEGNSGDFLDLSKNILLDSVNLSYCKFSSLNMPHSSSLKSIMMRSHKVKTLDVSGCINLKKIYCSSGALTSLNASLCSKLEYLNCSYNLLTSLNLSQCGQLKRLEAQRNLLSAIDLNDSPNLEYVSLPENKLSMIGIPQSPVLTFLSLGNNKFEMIDLRRFPALTDLSIELNLIKNLDVSVCTHLARLSCAMNRLRTLDVSKNGAIEQVWCARNLDMDTVFVSETQLLSTYQVAKWSKDSYVVWSVDHVTRPPHEDQWKNLYQYLPDATSLWVGSSFIAAMSPTSLSYASIANLSWNTSLTTAPHNILTKVVNYEPNSFFLLMQDTLLKRSSVYTINLENYSVRFDYLGQQGEVINDISYNGFNDQLVGVGERGRVVVYYPRSQSLNSYQVSSERDFTSVGAMQSSILAYGNGILSSLNVYTGAIVDIDSSISDVKKVIAAGDWAMLVGKNLYSYQDGNTATQFVQNFGPLYGKDIVQGYGAFYVTTEKGLFATSNISQNYLQFSPETKYKLRALGCYVSGTTLWAITEDGYLISNKTPNKNLRPYASIRPAVKCSDELSNFMPQFDMVGAYKWYINENVVSRNKIFEDSLAQGKQMVSLVVTNGYYADTAQLEVNSLSRPSKLLPFQLLDSVVCKTQGSRILLPNTDTSFYYHLVSDQGYRQYGSVKGTGQSALLESGSLWGNKTGKFQLEIKDENEYCSQLTDSHLNIRVERTQASFHFDEINSDYKEPIHFFATPKDANLYDWKFGPNASPSTSTDKNPIITYSITGATEVKLQVMSSTGCQDSLTLRGPYLLTESSLEKDCWTTCMVNEDPNWAGYYTNYFQDMKLIGDGDMVVCGHYNDDKFLSTSGQNEYTLGQAGAYLARYNKNGVLKWIVKSRHEDYHPDLTYWQSFTSLCVDKNQNIHTTTNFLGYTNPHLQFSRGDSIVYENIYGATNWILTLNSDGKLLQKARLYNGTPTQIAVDSQGNRLIAGWLSGPLRYVNGKDSLVAIKTDRSLGTQDGSRFILKIDPQGKFLWALPIYETTSSELANKMVLDGNGNAYIAGMYRYDLTLTSSDTAVNRKILYGSGTQMFVAKYNTEGLLQWVIKGNNDANEYYAQTYVNDIVAQKDGTLYVTGSTRYSGSRSLTIVQPDGSIDSSSYGGFFLKKISTDGYVEWSTGDQFSAYGGATALDLIGDKLAVHSYFLSGYGGLDYTYLVSTNGDKRELQITPPHITTVLVYDTTGNLQDVFPIKEGFRAMTLGPVSIKWKDYNTLYYGMEAHGNPDANPTFTPVCDPITLSNYDGFWGKMKLGDGIITSLKPTSSSEKKRVKIYPNPTLGRFTVEVPGNEKIISIQLYNSEGKEVAQGTTQSHATYQLGQHREFKPGIYSVRIKTDHSVYMEKLLVLE